MAVAWGRIFAAAGLKTTNPWRIQAAKISKIRAFKLPKKPTPKSQINQKTNPKRRPTQRKIPKTTPIFPSKAH